MSRRTLALMAAVLVAAAVITATQFAKDSETIVLRILVLNEAGEPVPGAAVRGFFFVEQVQKERLDGNVAGITGQDGRVEIDGMEDIYVDVQVDKDGYYRSTRRVVVRDAETRKHGSDQTIRLRKQIDPMAMYVKQLAMASEDAGSEPHGYDLVAGDFVEPLGRGSINDLLITFVHKPGSSFDWSWTHSVTFSNPGDGLIPVQLDEPDSEFKSAYRAPEDGYLGEWSLEMSRTGMNEAATGNTDPNRSYYFRIRTQMDPNGDVSGGLYGKIYGEFPKITYYLNPETGNRNVEWDISRNLLDPLPILNRASAP